MVFFDILAEVFIEVVFRVLVAYPGGFIVWIAQGRRRSISETINKHMFRSVCLGILVWLVILVLYFSLGSRVPTFL